MSKCVFACASLLSAKLKTCKIHLSRLGVKNLSRENFHFYNILNMLNLCMHLICVITHACGCYTKNTLLINAMGRKWSVLRSRRGIAIGGLCWVWPYSFILFFKKGASAVSHRAEARRNKAHSRTHHRAVHAPAALYSVSHRPGVKLH